MDAVTGIIKADVGIKGNRIVGIGKAGNPDMMKGVDSNMIVGATTECWLNAAQNVTQQLRNQF